jgi:hypothetical protein
LPRILRTMAAATANTMNAIAAALRSISISAAWLLGSGVVVGDGDCEGAGEDGCVSSGF